MGSSFNYQITLDSSHRVATNTAPPSPVYHHNQQNPFQHLIIQTQNQQNQTKNNSKSTQNNLKSTKTPLENPSQTQLKINPKQNQLKIKPKIHPKSLCFNHLHHHHHLLWSVKKKKNKEGIKVYMIRSQMQVIQDEFVEE